MKIKIFLILLFNVTIKSIAVTPMVTPICTNQDHFCQNEKTAIECEVKKIIIKIYEYNFLNTTIKTWKNNSLKIFIQ